MFVKVENWLYLEFRLCLFCYVYFSGLEMNSWENKLLHHVKTKQESGRCWQGCGTSNETGTVN